MEHGSIQAESNFRSDMRYRRGQASILSREDERASRRRGRSRHGLWMAGDGC